MQQRIQTECKNAETRSQHPWEEGLYMQTLQQRLHIERVPAEPQEITQFGEAVQVQLLHQEFCHSSETQRAHLLAHGREAISLPFVSMQTTI